VKVDRKAPRFFPPGDGCCPPLTSQPHPNKSPPAWFGSADSTRKKLFLRFHRGQLLLLPFRCTEWGRLRDLAWPFFNANSPPPFCSPGRDNSYLTDAHNVTAGRGLCFPTPSIPGLSRKAPLSPSLIKQNRAGTHDHVYGVFFFPSNLLIVVCPGSGRFRFGKFFLRVQL